MLQMSKSKPKGKSQIVYSPNLEFPGSSHYHPFTFPGICKVTIFVLGCLFNMLQYKSQGVGPRAMSAFPIISHNYFPVFMLSLEM